MRFDLVPARPCPDVDSIDVSLVLDRQLEIEWRVTGSIESLVWPNVTDSPSRVTGLWESTCFECFLARDEDSAYIELNVSPSGNWNSFAFTSLREGMHETSRLECNATEVGVETHRAAVKARLTLDPGLESAPRFRVGLSAVIADHSRRLHYFALRHETPRPDFHDPRNHRLIERALLGPDT